MQRYPDFLIIGAMKCATTTLSAQLNAQPGIFMVSEPKELYFFSYDHVYERGIDWYTSHFGSVPAHERCGEAATTYTQLPTYPDTVERMHHHLPDAKLIYIMRHPIDRLVSQYIHEYTLRKITDDINTAIARCPRLVEYSSYAMQLKPYLDTFGYDQILPVFYERICAHPQAELERICQYIGYAGSPVWNDQLKKNVSKERLMKHPILNALRKSPALKPIREHLVPASLKQRIKDQFTVKMETPTISPDQHRYLQGIFDADLAELGNWLGIQLSCDRYEDAVRDTAHTWNPAAVSSTI